MINKTGALLYLKQPLKYSSDYITKGDCGFSVVPKNKTFTIPTRNKQVNATRTLDANNYKAKFSASIGTSTVKFINALDTPHGGQFLDKLHIGRVFNRAVAPSGKDCFFKSGGMGSSNGTVTPKVPVAWTPEGINEGGKADVYALNIVSGGETGTAKFRYATYPFEEFIYLKTGSSCSVSTSLSRRYFFYSEPTVLQKGTDSVISKIVTEVGFRTNESNYSNTVSGACAESRYLESGETFTFVLETTKNKIKIYTDPTLTTLDREIALTTSSGESLTLDCVTSAKGVLYGIDTSKVYKINGVTGVATEMTNASQIGTDVFIFANYAQTKVYCITDGNVKIIDVSDDSVTTPVNSLPATPFIGETLINFVMDVEGHMWFRGKRYDGETLAVIASIPNYGAVDFYFPSLIINGGSHLFVYTIDGEKIKESDFTGGNNSSSAYPVSVNAYGMQYKSYEWSVLCDVHLSAFDYKRQKYRGTKKDWKIWNGTEWSKGWFTETPNGWQGDTYLQVGSMEFARDYTYKDFENEVDITAGNHNVFASIKCSSYGSGTQRLEIRFTHIDSGETTDCTLSYDSLRNYFKTVSTTVNLPYTGKYSVKIKNTSTSSTRVTMENFEYYNTGITETNFSCNNTKDIIEGTFEAIADLTTTITDNGDGTLSDGGTINYSTGEFSLNAPPAKYLETYYEISSDAVTGLNVALQDGVVVDFENGVENPHFVKGDYFSFTVAEGHVVDNLEAYSASADIYIVTFHDVASEVFTINSENMNVTKQSMTNFIKLDSDIGLTGTIAGTEATITTSQTPDAGAIGVDYNTGALYFNAADNGKQAIINYRWLERPS